MKKIKTALIALSCLFLVGGGLTACNPEDPTPIVTISNGETATLEVGKTLQLNVTKEHTDDAITYTSSNTNVATVSDSGLITAVAKGETTITAEAGDITDTIKITVTEPAVTVIDVASVTLNKTEITLEIGGTETLTATVLPENATDKTVTWETSNVEVATIANGVVTAVAKGEATITAKAGEKTATCKVIVNEPAPAYLTIAEAKDKAVGETITVRGEVTAVSGKSAYIADQTGGFYVYNWSFNGDDTAIVDGSWVLGMNVEVHGQIAEFSNLIQISNWDDARIEGTYAIEIEDDVTPMTPIALTEEGYKALTEKDAGNLYKFTAEYVSGTPSTGSNVSTTWKLGSANITLRTDKYDKVGIDEKFVAGDVYEITTPLSWYGSNPQFALLGTGTILNKQVVVLESLSLSASAEKVNVGQTVELTAVKTPLNGEGDIEYKIIEGGDFATLNGNILTGVAAGTVKVQAEAGTIKSNEVTIEVVAEAKVTYDWSKGWDSLTYDENATSSAMGGKFNNLATNFFDNIKNMSPNQTEIESASITGQVYQSGVVVSDYYGFLMHVMDSMFDIPTVEYLKPTLQPVITLNTAHDIKSVTLDLIPCKTAIGVSFDINGKAFKETGTYSGTISDKVTAKVDLDTPTKNIVITQEFVANNQFAIIGMTLEW